MALDANTLKARWHVQLSAAAWSLEPLALSPNGQHLAVAGQNGAVRLLSAQSGRWVNTLQHPFYRDQKDGSGDFFATPTALAFSPDGRTLAIGSRGGGVRLRSLANGQERQLSGGCTAARTAAHLGPVRGLLFTDAGTLVSTANDEQLVAWPLRPPRQARCLSLPGGATSLHLLPQGRLLALGVTSSTLLHWPEVTRLARLAPLGSALVRWQITDTTLALSDQHSTRRWGLLSAAPLPSTALPLATFHPTGATVTIGDDLRVRVKAAGHTRVLWPPAVAPANLDGLGVPVGWQVRLKGGQLTVSATSNVRTMTNGTTDFTNNYVWAWPSGRFLGCRTLHGDGDNLSIASLPVPCRTREP
ncbi:WD40 repeat domain-containing protein [Deinococcus arboris]|uniref:WD40 repeat domain-containing protein n=1 Tax=Deinococcus arboris TaxID=2682977 RepID=UPI0018DC8EE2